MITRTFDDVFAPPEAHGHAESDTNVMFGFWLYLMSDCILFAALFASYVVYTPVPPAVRRDGSFST